MKNRRTFFKTTAAAGATLPLFNISALGAGTTGKLNIAVIGVGGRAKANIRDVKHENIVALCDVHAGNLAVAAKEFPNAKTYTDWRKCLEQKDLDAVVCSTTDHTHAFVAIWAMNRGLHVYCEKPLANSVEEARMVRDVYLNNKGKLATQMGTQIHAGDNYRRVVELIRAGAIGNVTSCKVWVGRERPCESYHPASSTVPSNIDWDLWIGPAPFHPYSPEYLKKGCLTWNRFWDFGNGQLGDMASHLIDLPYWALDLKDPISCVAKSESAPHPDGCPSKISATWEHPARGDRPAVKVSWYDGGYMPGLPSKIFDREKLSGKGILFSGDEGWLLADYGWRNLTIKGDMTHFNTPSAEDLIPKSAGHHQEWINGCKTGSPTLCNFDYSGKLVEHNLLGNVAFRVGKKLEWDAANMRALNCPEAEPFIRHTYRKGWVLNG